MGNLPIQYLWFTQRKLKRAEQIPSMVEMLLSGGCLPRIHLNRLEDGQIEINDGHHRVTAVWASGRAELRPDEYLLIETEKPKSRFYRLGTKYETL